jgi:hypothetical protein
MSVRVDPSVHLEDGGASFDIASSPLAVILDTLLTEIHLIKRATAGASD